ncbi:hypothetical protein IA539_13760 [Gordonia sp. zg691]|uniref:hypothetical protein n=1 Tax=Gordonia jinghuaiqii TaxID=2758710 RepID=UPI0016626225|nr:hypothetical protein [Gordonia jinghuaiqii]MBD0862273.1 hypothetical protein [Gordonia jinghuaiqii]
MGQPDDPSQPYDPGQSRPGRPYDPSQPYDPGRQYDPGQSPPGQPWPQQAYPPPLPPREDRAGMRRWGKILTVVGVVLLLLSVTIGVVMAVAGIGDAVDKAFEVNPTAEQNYDTGDTFQLFSSNTESGVPACEITGPAALAPGPGTTSEFTFDGSGVESFDSFEVVESGTYTFRCDSPAVVASIDAAGIFSGVGGVLLAVFGGGFGGLVAVVGVVLWIIAGRKPATA